MSEELYKQIGLPTLGNRTIKFRGAGSGENITLGGIRVKICIDMEIYDIIVDIVRDGMIPQGMLIGSDFLNNVEVCIKKGVVKISKIADDSIELSEVYKVDVIQDDKDVDLTHIKDENLRKEVECLVKEYKPMKEKDVKVKMTIIVNDDIPVIQSPRRLSVTEKAEVDSQLRVWLNEGIVQPSYSDCASPIVLVKKKMAQQESV